MATHMDTTRLKLRPLDGTALDAAFASRTDPDCAQFRNWLTTAEIAELVA